MKKILAIMLAMIFVLAVMTAAIGAEEQGAGGDAQSSVDGAGESSLPSYLPTDIKGETKYAFKSVVSFDEEGIESGLQPQKSPDKNNQRPRCDFEVIETGGVNGKALKMISNGNTAEGNINFTETQDWSKYDGLMVWVDMTGVIPNQSKVEQTGAYGGLGIRVFSVLYDTGKYAWTRNGGSNNNPPPLPDFQIDAWYLEGGEWKLCNKAAQDGERLQVPENFAGWLYIPFTSYITVAGSEGGPEQGIYQSEFINKIMLLTGPYKSDDPAKGEDKTSIVIVDEINLVKLGVTNEELEEQLKATEATTTEAGATSETRVKATMPTTAAKTTAPAKTTAAAADTTAAEEEKSGCGSSITVASVMMIAAAAAIPAVATKRRRK